MIDLRSDTLTVPTPEMRRAMADAEVGDDVYQEDPTANRLQERAAETFGREASLFVPSGSMGNQIAVKLHTRPGQEVVLESRSHIFNGEMACVAAISGCLARPLRAEKGRMAWEQIESALNPDVYYNAKTALIALENSHNAAGGTVMTRDEVETVADKAHGHGIPVHLDGARIFNAALASGSSVADLTRACDSVMFCLSKGLCAPVGSMLVGSRALIEEARRIRKLLGGGMRQVGILAAAGLIALEQMPKRLHEDHENARLLAEALHEGKSFQIDLDSVQTNIVMTDLKHFNSTEFLARLKEKRVLAADFGPRKVRFVTHKDVSREDILQVIKVIRTLAP